MVKLRDVPWYKERIADCPSLHTIYVEDTLYKEEHRLKIHQPLISFSHTWSRTDVQWLIKECQEWLDSFKE